MKIEDIGFIIYTKKYEEDSIFVKILSKENGVINGYFQIAKYNRTHCQIGNLVKFSWFAKNITQLGTFKIELIKSYTSCFIENKFNLRMFENMTILTHNLLLENYLPDDKLFMTMKNILNNMNRGISHEFLIKKYFYFENLLLNILGTGIVSDKKNLKNLSYISKKSGLAVTKEKGEPYKEKLLLFPIIAKTNNFTKKNVIECFEVIEFFFEKYLVMEIGDKEKYNNIANTRGKFKKMLQ
jgi:DNA repair protein RecO (recombination protein O)